MRSSDFKPESPGSLTAITVTVRSKADGDWIDLSSPAFVPDPLPVNLTMETGLLRLLDGASQALAELNAKASASPIKAAVARPIVRQEAVSSSRIEGTRSSFADLVKYEQLTMFDKEAPARFDEDEVLAYVRALEYGWSQPIDSGVTSALIRSIHRILMEHSPSPFVDPGQFRRSVVYIGGQSLDLARFVPAPPQMVPELMQSFEKQSSARNAVPRLIWIAMLHYLFETIHPFNDGNGRTGRLLILLHLRQAGLLAHPVLHLSRFIEQSKADYIELLTAVSVRGAWNEWIAYMLDAIGQESRRSVAVFDRLESLRFTYLDILADRRQDLGQRATDYLFAEPIFSIATMSATLAIPYNTAKRVVDRWVEAGVVEQTTAGNRNRRFAAPAVLEAYDLGISQ